MGLANTRAAFETAILDAIQADDPTVTVVFDNTPFAKPGKTKNTLWLL